MFTVLRFNLDWFSLSTVTVIFKHFVEPCVFLWHILVLKLSFSFCVFSSFVIVCYAIIFEALFYFRSALFYFISALFYLIAALFSHIPAVLLESSLLLLDSSNISLTYAFI